MHMFRLKRCESGVSLIEFAIVLPLLILMLIGTVETSRYIIVNQKLDKVVYAMADFVTQGANVATTDLNAFVQAAPQIMSPFTFNGTIVFSSVAFFNVGVPPCTGSNVPCISWQYAVGGDASLIGRPGGNAILPGGYSIIPGQNAIVAEVFMNYTPMLTLTGTLIPALGPQKIYKFAVYKPRQGTLTVLN